MIIENDVNKKQIYIYIYIYIYILLQVYIPIVMNRLQWFV